MPKNTLYIIRHGESENNVLRIDSTRLENVEQFGLTKNGESVIREEAKKFNDFDLILCSPFRRTRETAAIFAETSQCEVLEDVCLREVDVGDFELCSYDKSEAFIEENGEGESFPNGESLLDAKNRVIEFFERIKQEYNDKRILLVTHGYLIEALLGYLYKDFDWNDYLKEYDSGRRVFEIIG